MAASTVSRTSPLSPVEMTAAQRLAEEKRIYARRRPGALAASLRHDRGMLDGVPLHWMLDWPTPFPMVVAAAQGARLTDIDGNGLWDFCLGDTGAMYGHSPAPIAKAIQAQLSKGLTVMLPSDDCAAVGEKLADLFGLPFWQVASTASDANRFAIRVARAVTRRPKILVFDGCYHGAVDDTLVDLEDGRTVTRRSLLGQVTDLSATTVAIPFNDIPALEKALAGGDIALVLAEPAMTNCGMILPQPGYHDALRRLTRAAGTLLLIDETHTVSTALGGYSRAHGLEPDLFVVGKAIAGGIPASVWGMSADVAERLRQVHRTRPPGHSGIGTTLSGSPLQLACIRACLSEIMTAETYGRMEAMAQRIEHGLQEVIARHRLPWHVARLGARLEVVFSPSPVANAAEMHATAQPEVEAYLHLAMLNRGFLLTPFHNMLLVCPEIAEEQADSLVAAYDAVLAPLGEVS